MRFSTFIFTLKQGIVSIFRNKWYSLASIATISACLFMFGIFYSIVANFQYIVKEAQNGVSVTIFFDEDISDERVVEIGSLVEARTEVDHVYYVSADEAWESFREEYLGEYADGFTENPLEDSDNYEIFLRDASLQDSLVNYLETVDGIRLINKSDQMANALAGMDKLVGYVAVGIIVILLCVSVFLIGNTVTIGISVRKEEINIMKYIGATDFFVRFPFVIEGILIGVLGSLVPLAIVYLVYNNIIGLVLNKFTVLHSILKFLTVGEIFHTLVPISVCIGVGIGFIGSVTTVRKHIRV